MFFVFFFMYYIMVYCNDFNTISILHHILVFVVHGCIHYFLNGVQYCCAKPKHKTAVTDYLKSEHYCILALYVRIHHLV